ncbi:MAG: serine--tRNA ligase [Deltaproteobacteria bacterium]|nr:serine--tRNA ligase [Deltaproteobacteria bacterium]
MIDLNDVRERPEAYELACEGKGIKFDVQGFLELDRLYRAARAKAESLRAQQNVVSKQMPRLSGEEKQQKLAEMKNLSVQLKQEQLHLRDLEDKWNRDQLLIPSVPLAKVPLGKDSDDNVEVRRWGKLPEFGFKERDHVELGRLLDIIDIERGVKIAGARSYFLKGDGMRLEQAVLALAMDLMQRKGYTLMACPHIVKYDAMMGTGYFPGGEEMAYHLDERDAEFYLIGTSEVSVCSYHLDEILEAHTLPRRYAGFSPCYRREAGTYGKDTQGLYRIHQFYKVEQVIICKADAAESAKMHAELLANAEELMQLLELPYRVVDVCSGDMGQGQVYKNDIEAWMPSRQSWGETHSCSTFYDFQARRLKLRYRAEAGETKYCHTLNNTLIASPRILIPLLENNQNSDGSVTVPKALRPFMGGQELIKAQA